MLLLQALLYAVAVAAIDGVARAVRRRLPTGVLILCGTLPVLFLLPGFFSEKTLAPVADTNLFAPWAGRVPASRHTIWLNDVATQLAPWREATQRAWQGGELPLRNRWSGCGQPLATNHQSSPFAPWRLLALPLPTAVALNLEAALKLLLALTGAWLWVQELGASRLGACVGAILFAFSLAMTAWLLFPHSGVLALWPWAFWAIELSRDRSLSRRAMVLLIAVFALWPLAGHPEAAALGAAFAFLWLAGRALLRDLPDWKRLALRIGLAAVAAIALTAFWLLPGTLSILASNRLENVASILDAARPPLRPLLQDWRFVIFPSLFPTAFGDPDGQLPRSAGNFLDTGLGWVGSLGWVFMALLARPGSGRSRAGLAALLPLLLGFAVAAGFWPTAEAIRMVPAFSHVFPIRYLCWFTPAAALIAAMELTRLQRDASRRPVSLSPLLSSLAVAGAITATFLLFRGSWQDGPDEALRDLALWLALGSLAAFGVLAALLGRARRTAALLLLLLPLVELFWMGRQIYRFHPSEWHFPETPAVAFLRAQTGTFRIVGAGAAMFPSTAVFAGVDEIRTHDPMERRDYVALLDEAAGYPREHYFKMIRNLDAPILDLLNVRYLIAPPTTAAPSTRWRTVYESGDAVIFENASVLPRVFAPKAVTWIDAPPPEPFVRNALTRFGSAAGEMFANPDFRSRAWVTGPGPAPTLAPMEAVGYREGVNRASFHIEPPRRDGEGLLIASLLQDGGWRAHDERGRRLATALANGPFLAIRVPADASGVRLTYAPPGFRTGVVISLATLLVLATLGLLHLGRSVTRSVRRADPR